MSKKTLKDQSIKKDLEENDIKGKTKFILHLNI